MMSRSILCLTTILISVLCVSDVVESRTFDKIIAYVNDEVITNWELENIVKQRALELNQIHHFSEREAVEKARKERPELLDRLIRQMLLVETALTLKIEITKQELNLYEESFKERAQIKTEEEFTKQLKSEGFTLAAFREKSKRNLMAERLLEMRIFPKLQVRNRDVLAFFAENRGQFTTKSDSINLRHILIAPKPTEAEWASALGSANTVVQRAEAGEDFEALATLHADKEEAESNDGSAIELPLKEIDKLSKPFRALATLAEGEVSQPIQDNQVVHVLKVERKTDQAITFRHLIIRPNISEDSARETQKRATFVYQKLKQNEDFKTLAIRYSDDSETSASGGNLGTRLLNELTPEIRKIVEGLDAGQYHEPVKMGQAIHIFKVDSRIPPELNDLEKNQIRAILRQQKFQEEWTAYTDLLLENAYVKIKPLD